MNVFQRIFQALNEHKVKYLVVGGVAVNLYGYLRFTGDLDILILLDEKNLQKIDAVMKKLGYTERLPVSVMELKNEKQVRQWLKEKNLKAFSFFPPNHMPLQIDILVEASLKFKSYASKKTSKHLGDIAIPVVSIEDLIKMKKKANRDKDRLDLEALLQLKLL